MRVRSRTMPLTLWAAGFAVLAIVLFNVQGWFVLQRTSRVLEKELGDRLQAIATTLSLALRGKLEVRNSEFELAEGVLSEAMEQNELFNVYVVNDQNEYLLNLRSHEMVGHGDPVLELDMPEILAAFSGMPTQSKLYRAGAYFLKSAYAPLEDSVGNVFAVLGVEADAGFFAVLAGFRRSMLVINGLSLLAIAVLVLVSLSLARHALRVEQAAGRANTLALMGQMSAALAHEIKNPLAIIRAAAERLKKRYGAGSDDPTFDYVTEETDRLAKAVSNYLGIGAFRPGEVELLDVGEVVKGVVEDMRPEAMKHKVELAFSRQPSADGRQLLVSGNRNELRQVFLNLVLNGIQAQPDGGRVAVTGALERKREKGTVVIRVADTGPGIDRKSLSRVWEPFYTTKEKGSGLGLFVVKRLISAHRGRVEITSAPGEGTAVEVRLPEFVHRSFVQR